MVCVVDWSGPALHGAGQCSQAVWVAALAERLPDSLVGAWNGSLEFFCDQAVQNVGAGAPHTCKNDHIVFFLMPFCIP